MKQTAVKWLLQEFSDIIGKVSFTVTQDLFITDAAIKAKEMEKEQIVNAFDTGHRIGAWNFLGDEYYEKNFKNKTK